jgi:phosphatidate cytidylyltransferase
MSEPKSINTGRNLPMATAVGLGLLGGVIASLYFDRWFFAIAAAVAVFFASRELIALLRSRGAKLSSVWLPIFVSAMILFGYGQGLAAALVMGVFGLLVLWAVRLSAGVDGYTADVTASAFIILYVGAGISFAAALANHENGFGRVVAIILLTAGNDTGGYFAGILAGRHPMLASISPKKTWEGFAGSVALQSIVGIALIPLLLDVSWWQGWLFALAMTVTATLGDLMESAIKRDAGAKDSGDILPGHGGMLDRIDGLLVNAPMAWIWITIILGV